MTKAFLKEKGVDEAIINDIMAEYGKGIEREKAKAVEIKEELEKSKQSLVDFEKKVKELEVNTGDTAELKSQIEALNSKIAEREKQDKEAEANAKLKEELDALTAELDALQPKDMKFINDYAKNGVYKEAIDTYKANKTLGLEKAFNSIVKDDKGNYKDGIYSTGAKLGDMQGLGNADFTASDDLVNSMRRSAGLAPLNAKE